MMKKILAVLSLALAVNMGGVVSANAAQQPEVVVDKDGKIHTQNIDFKAFEGMAAGETAVETINVRNESDEAVNLYISQNTLQTLEESKETDGAAYEFNLCVGETFANAVSLLEKPAGGYDGDSTASAAGLSEIDELEDYTFFTNLEPGESTNLYMTIFLNGERNDIDYSNAIGKLELSFKCDTRNNQRAFANVVKRIPVIKYVKTGDKNMILLYGVIFLAGVGVITLTVARKHKRKKEA